eukprot:TRINITY_DN106346_c0_g1_i1.p1 TRINITY_DN106346_c0_g1~~TRINITY_DN106346_c0_g1_i1.p1  ORF type:complete len:397 (-),score=71.65 TRINITY_DN106346_c0_g1_i1:34-1224(-)
MRPSARWDDEAGAPADTPEDPVLKPLSEAVTRKTFAGAGVAGLVLAWCVFDNWNESVSTALFSLGVADGTAEQHGEAKYFDSPLALTFLQFLFMGLLFGGLWYAFAADRRKELAQMQRTLVSAPWPLLVMTHVFSCFWLQALMMPTQMLSLGAFAVSRGMEVPLAAALRCLALRLPCGGHAKQVTVAMFAANTLLFYSYVNMEGCVCIYSGHGMWLVGLPLYATYALLLLLPALNLVCQETLMTEYNVNPLLMLALQNVAGCIVFSPVLLFEDMKAAASMLLQYQEIALLVLWLCIQVAASSWVSTLLVRSLDSFWAVAFRSFRVVYWWCCQLVVFYLSTSSLLSIRHPRVSAWSFGMLAGIGVVVWALLTDTKPKPSDLLKGSPDKGHLETTKTV